VLARVSAPDLFLGDFMNYYRVRWSCRSGSQMVEGKRVVQTGGIAQAIVAVKFDVSSTLGIDPSEVTISMAEETNIIDVINQM